MFVACDGLAMSVAIQLVSSLFSSGRKTGIVMYSGDDGSQTDCDKRGARSFLHFVVARLHSVQDKLVSSMSSRGENLPI